MSAHTLPAHAAPTSSPLNILARYPLRSYFTIAFAVVWLALLPFVLSQNGLGLLPINLPDWSFIVAFIGGTIAGPTLGALLVTGATEGKAGIRRFLRRYVQWRVGFRWYVITLFGYLALFLTAATLVQGVEPLQTFAAQWPLLFTSYPLLLLSMIVFPALIEEPGWRGFALPRLQVQYGPLRGTLLLGFLHAIWHLPVYMLVSGPAAMGPFNIVNVVFNTIGIMALTIFWTWVVNHTGGSILIAILLHAASNATGQLLGSMFPNVPIQVEYTQYALTIVIAALIVVSTKGQLGYTKVPSAALDLQ